MGPTANQGYQGSHDLPILQCFMSHVTCGIYAILIATFEFDYGLTGHPMQKLSCVSAVYSTGKSLLAQRRM